MTVNLSRNLHPMRLSRRSAPFNSDDFIFELKIDGFRSLAFVENGQCDLLSRNENTFHNFKHFTQWIGENLRVANAVLDGEIACVDQYGRSVFNDLLFRRRECVFFAFDLLFLDGDDLRNVPLVERKARLKKLLRRKRSRVLYVDHVEFRGQKFFQKVCELDLEGIVAKRKDSYYRAPRSLCGIGSKSRILSIARQKGVTSCLIALQTDTVQGQATTYTVGRDHRVSLEAASSVIQISGAPQ